MSVTELGGKELVQWERLHFLHQRPQGKTYKAGCFDLDAVLSRRLPRQLQRRQIAESRAKEKEIIVRIVPHCCATRA